VRHEYFSNGILDSSCQFCIDIHSISNNYKNNNINVMALGAGFGPAEDKPRQISSRANSIPVHASSLVLLPNSAVLLSLLIHGHYASVSIYHRRVLPPLSHLTRGTWSGIHPIAVWCIKPDSATPTYLMVLGAGFQPALLSSIGLGFLVEPLSLPLLSLTDYPYHARPSLLLFQQMDMGTLYRQSLALKVRL